MKKLLHIFLFTAYSLQTIGYCFSQGTWTEKTSFPGVRRLTAVAFSIGNKGYLGTGVSSGGELDDFWEYDPIADSWTQKANFGGMPRSYAVGFSIGQKGYIGLGVSSKDFWEYDPSNNFWTQKTSFAINIPGPGVPQAGAFSMNGKGYVGTGGYDSSVWEYNPVTDLWIQKNNFIGAPRTDIDRGTFVIGNKAYWGGGVGFTDFWEYDPANDIWTQKNDIPDGTERYGATGFSICNKGFLGLGNNSKDQMGALSDFWQYDPIINSWTTIAPFPGGARVDAPSFVINNKAYVGTGSDNVNFYKDFWEYAPDFLPTLIIIGDTIITQGETVTLTASVSDGTPDYTYVWNSDTTNSSTIFVKPSVTSEYCVKINDANNCIVSSCITINVEDVLCGEVFIPSIFSPNSDGYNDFLYVRGNCISELLFFIYNRWGEKVFETKDKSIGWDGTYKGKQLNTGVFVYFLKVSFEDGEKKELKGNVTLLR